MKLFKTCATCKKRLPREAFSKVARGKDGLRRHCKECLNARARELRKGKIFTDSYVDITIKRREEAEKREEERIKELSDKHSGPVRIKYKKPIK